MEMRYLGVDLHSNSMTVCYLTKSGKEELRTYSLSALAEFQKSLRRSDQVAVEATGNTRWFVGQIKERVGRVVIVNPNQFEVIRKSVKKTDRHDARALAQFLSKDLLPEARLKDERAAQINSLAETRDKLVKLRTTFVNKLHALHRGRGINSRKSQFLSEKGLRGVLEREWETATRVEIEVIIGQLRSVNEGIKRLEAQMAESGAQLKGHANLVSIKGIGPKAASILLSVIGEVNDFESEEKLASYFGIVPRVSNSNERVQHGRITKRGSKLGRTCLVQCTLAAKRYSAYLNSYYERIKARKGGGKAIIATARKFLGIIFRTLKHNWMFADFPNFVLAED
jgi:transposase